MLEAVVREGVVGRAIEREVLQVALHDLRDHSADRHRSVDDVAYGGGPGMVLKPEPFFRAVAAIRRRHGDPDAVVLLSPQGRVFRHEEAARLSRLRHVALLCGRYEGVDERIRGELCDEELSIGDLVLAGGELAALVVVEAVARLLPGVLGNEASTDEESFSSGLLEYPQYTRPADFRGNEVPEVLRSGDHARIAQWRHAMAIHRTLERRPDLIQRRGGLTDEERSLLEFHGLAGPTADTATDGA